MANSFKETDLQKVRTIENKRIAKGYKPGWTYYQARSSGILETFYYLQKRGEVGTKKQNVNNVNEDSFSISKGQNLTIELVPATCWFSNVRSHVTNTHWNELKKITSSKANKRCEVCGGRGPKWPIECHEIWNYDDSNKVQTLKGLMALCPVCHEVKHMGLANIKGRGKIASQHLAKVNNWNLSQTYEYIDKQFKIWEERSKFQWKLDVSWLEQYGIKISVRSRIKSEFYSLKDSAKLLHS